MEIISDLKLHDKTFKVKEILNSVIAQDDLLKIVELKMTIWNYSKESQFDWIKSHVIERDIHYLLSCDEILVGYLCICMIKVSISESEIEAYGFSNVCIKKSMQKKGIGTLFVKTILDRYQNKPFILLTSQKNYNFYNNIGFNSFNGTVYINNVLNKDIICFYKNIDLDGNSIYIDRNF